MLDARPTDTQVELIGPTGVGDGYLDEFDHIIVTGFYQFGSIELNEIARHKFSLWIHDVQLSGHWLYESAANIICLTPEHRDYEVDKNPMLKTKKIQLNPGTLSDTDQMYPEEKQNFALWAHRDIEHKGEDLAHEWAQQEHVNLQVYKNIPRFEVIERMRQARYFILLSHIFDPGPRAVMEAQLCGCMLILNENVGRWELPREELITLLEQAPYDFWGRVLNA